MAGPAIVLYDGQCPLCVRAAAFVRRLDRTGRLRFVSAHDPGAASLAAMDVRRLLERMVLVAPDGPTPTLEGFRAIVGVASRVPALWPLLPGLALLGWLGLGRPLYDFVAQNRHRIFRRIPRGCLVGTCGIKPGAREHAPLSLPLEGTRLRAGSRPEVHG